MSSLPKIARPIAMDAELSKRKDTAYKGYLIRQSYITEKEFFVTKNGSYIATYSSLEAAKRGIDELTS